jgi:O-antigen/teichoic acid export membrane protein
VKIAVVMTLFTQMYRLAAEPFFLSGFRKEEFKEANAAAMRYFVMASMLIFLGIVLFRDLFALIVGEKFREGIDILPLVLAANVLAGVWLNLSFWYKREEKTKYAAYITFLGLGVTIVLSFVLIPTWGYRGAAWVRLAAEAAMVVWSFILCHKHYPLPFDYRRMAEYVVVAAVIYALSEVAARYVEHTAWVALNGLLFLSAVLFAVRRERIDVAALCRAAVKKFVR